MGTNCFLSQCKRSLNSTTNKQKVPVGNYVQINNQDTTATCLDVIAVFVFGLNRFGYAIFKTNNHFHEHWSKFQPKIVSLFLTFGTFLFFLHCCHMSLPACSTSSVEWSYFLWGWSHFNDMLDYIIIQNLWHLFPVLKGLQVKLSGLGNIKHLSIRALTWITEFRYLRCIISYHIKREQQDSKAKHFCHKMKWKMGQKLLHNRRD